MYLWLILSHKIVGSGNMRRSSASKSCDRLKHWLNCACLSQPTQVTGRGQKPGLRAWSTWEETVDKSLTDTKLCRKVSDPWNPGISSYSPSNNWAETSAACIVVNKFHKLSPGKLLNKQTNKKLNKFEEALWGKSRKIYYNVLLKMSTFQQKMWYKKKLKNAISI